MAAFSICDILKEYRKRAGLTQAKLCEGLCEPPTYNKIEKGQQNPNKKLLDALVDKLNIPIALNIPVTKAEFERSIIETEIISYLSRNEYNNFEILLEQYKNVNSEMNKFEKQFYLYALSLFLLSKKEKVDLVLNRLEESILITFPMYTSDLTDTDHIYSSLEISILNNISICNFKLNKIKDAINILYNIKDFFNKYKNGTDLYKKKYPMISYNLSTWLGLQNRYEESLKITQEAIDFCLKYESYSSLGDLYYNHGYTLMMLNREKEGEHYLRKSIFFDYILNKTDWLKGSLDDLNSSFGTDFTNSVKYLRIE